MPRYEIRPGLPLATIPGVGVVKPGDVIEGDYDRFVPGKLRRVAGGAPVAVPQPPPPPPPEPEPEEEEEALTDAEAADQIPEFADEGEEDDDGEEGEDSDMPSMDWKKAELAAYAKELGLDTDGTKQDILDRIEEYLR